MQEIHKQILNLTAKGLRPDAALDAVYSDDLLPELLAQAVLSLVSQPDSPAWCKLSGQILAANMRVFYEHTELHELLSARGIPYVILKGCASASYYPDPMLRTMGDVDFLINPEDIPEVCTLLQSMGFEPEEESSDIHIAFHRGASTWELHRCVNGIPEGKMGEIVRCFLSDIMETAVDYNTGNGIIRIPDDFHHGLVLLLHTASHLISEGVGLRHLCDWAVFVNHFSSDQFTEIFAEKLSSCGLWRFARLLTLVSVRYLHLPHPSWAGEADDVLLEQLIADILDGGNFGNKDEDRYRQIKYISNRGAQTVDEKPTMLQLLDTIGKKAEAQGISPFAVAADYISMVLSGKRRPDTRKTHEQAAKRKKLYSQFRLFEEQR